MSRGFKRPPKSRSGFLSPCLSVSLSLAEFGPVAAGYEVSASFRVLPSFAELERIFLSFFNHLYSLLPGFTEFYRVLPSFAEFYRVLPSFPLI